jgi:hypothetical protein
VRNAASDFAVDEAEGAMEGEPELPKTDVGGDMGVVGGREKLLDGGTNENGVGPAGVFPKPAKPEKREVVDALVCVIGSQRRLPDSKLCNVLLRRWLQTLVQELCLDCQSPQSH